jgi:hypothetical protein
MTLPYSDAYFLSAYPRECTETFQAGHVAAFAFFGGVPTRTSDDNTSIAVKKVDGRDGLLTTEFLRLESHFLFEHVSNRPATRERHCSPSSHQTEETSDQEMRGGFEDLADALTAHAIANDEQLDDHQQRISRVAAPGQSRHRHGGRSGHWGILARRSRRRGLRVRRALLRGRLIPRGGRNPGARTDRLPASATRTL